MHWLGILGVAAVVSASVATAAESARQTSPEAPQGAAMGEIRNLATAMMIWLNDRAPGGPEGVSAAEKASYWKHCPAISAAELRALLVPDIIASVPDLDPWGNAYQLCLEREDFSHGGTLGIRCAGRDGTFQAEDYVEGPFDPTDFDQDIVLVDGFFMRWPRKPE